MGAYSLYRFTMALGSLERLNHFFVVEACDFVSVAKSTEFKLAKLDLPLNCRFK